MSGARSVPPSMTRLPAMPTAFPRLRSVRESPFVGRNQWTTIPMDVPASLGPQLARAVRTQDAELPAEPSNTDFRGRDKVILSNRSINSYMPTPTDRMPRVRIEQLEYLAEVARLGSFRRAAESLHISQPALSGAVRSLERELGVGLLERGRHGARVSDPGRDLLPHILTVLDSVDRLRQSAGEQQHSIRLVRVGTVNTATVPLLAPAI